MGGIFPEAVNLKAFWSNIVSKKECIRELPDYFDFEGYYKKEDYYDPDPRARDKTYAKRAGYLPEVEFDPLEFGIPPTALESVSQTQLMALLVAKETLQDAGLLEEGRNSTLRSRTGVVLGVAGFGDTAFQLATRLDHPNWSRVLDHSGIPEPKVSEIVERLKALYIEWNEDSFPGFLSNVVAGRIANRFDLRGLNCTVDAACASSLGAIKMAASELFEGNCDAVLTGGVQVENDVMSFLCFSKTPALSFEGVCRPYDADSDGMLLGTGVGMMVLKRLEDAERDQDRIYAVIKGIGASSDGRSTSIYAPDTAGQLAALRNCYEKAGLSPGDIQLLEGHGTGTKAGDACEILTILEFFRGAAPRSIALGSIKSQIGHLRAAAGAASMIKVALALYHKILPPTLHILNPNPMLAAEDAPFDLSSEPRPWNCPEGKSLRRGAVSSFGFGGTNFHLLLEEYPGQDAVPSEKQDLKSPTQSVQIEPGARSGKKHLKVAINGFRYLNPTTRARRDRALHGEAALGSVHLPADDTSADVFNPSDSPQRKTMEKPEQNRKKFKPQQPNSRALEMNQTISDKLEWQERLDRLQSQFHENQAGYINLLSRYMEKQYALIEKIPSGPQLDKILDSFSTIIQLLDKNQQRYHDNHDRYLQHQLQLLNGHVLGSGAPKERFPTEPLPERSAAPSERQRIPLRPSPQDGPYDVNPYSSPGKASAAPESIVPPRSGSTDNGFLSISVEQIMDKLRDIVADQTGYPKDMLEMDMDLETDMGVDSIKRLEILAAMQEAFPDMPMEIEEVGELRTLREIAAFLERYLQDHSSDRTPRKELSPPADSPDPSAGLPGSETAARLDPADVSGMIERLRGLILEKSGFLPDMLTGETDLDAVGLDLVQWIDIIAIMEDEFPDIKVDLQEMERLNTLGEIERYLCGSPAAVTSRNTGASSPAAPVAAPPVAAVSISEVAKKPDHPTLEPSPPAMFPSPHQVVISTATFEAEDSAPPKKRGRSILKKKLNEPDRLLSIPAENHLWVVMDEGEEVGKNLAGEMCKSGAKAVLLAFPENLVHYRSETTGTGDRITLPGCDEKQCKSALAEIGEKYGPISGFVYIHPFQKSTPASIADLFQKEESMAARLAFWIAKHLRTSMDPKPDRDRLSFIAVSRMDGELGVSGRKPFTIFGGSLSGLIQSLGREWPEVFCRFLDIAPELSATDAAALILKELADPGIDLREVGYDSKGKRCTWEIVEGARDPGRPAFLPGTETVFLVSGGGRGITAECAVALAETFHSKFILVGRTSAPDPEEEPEWARDCLDEKSLKQKIMSQMRDQRQRTTPVEVDKVLRPILAGREIRRTMRRIQQNGGKAIYCPADITNSQELRRSLKEARSKFGEIDALIHGAGNLADKKIQDKTSKDFDRVFTCKVEGLAHLLECLDLDRLRSVLLFSSITSLWGNAGQTDYAMANALLDKFAQCCSVLLPEKMATAVHWGPWDHGMVTPTLKKIYEEKNIGLISCAAGSRMCVELFKGNVEPQTVLCEKFLVPPSPMQQELRSVQVQRTVLPQANPFLQDHCIDGHPVLPATCAVHWMIQTCEALLPGHVFRELRQFKVLKGIVFQQGGPKDYVVQVEPAANQPRKTMAVKILSRSDEKPVYHYSAEIDLCLHTTLEAMPVHEEMDLSRNGRPREEYYGGVPLFHGKSFQGVREVCNLSPRHITVYACLPPLDDSAQGQFKVSSWNPYVTDVQLQSILLWSREILKAGCLPSSIGRIEQFRPIEFGEEFYISTRIQSQTQYRLLVDMTVHDAEGRIHMRWADVQLTVSRRLHEQFRKNRAENEP